MSEYEGSNKRIAKNTLLLYIRMGVSMLISLYTARITLQVLGDINFGILSVVGGVVTIFMFMNSSLSASTSRFIAFDLGSGNLKNLNKTFNATLVVHILLSLIMVLLCETAGLWLLYDKLIIPPDRMHAAVWAYQIGVLTTCIGIVTVPFNASIVAHEKMDVFALLSIVDIVMRLVLIFLLQYLPGDKLIVWSTLLAISSLLYMTFNVAYCKVKFAESKIHFHKDLPLYKRLFSYAWWDTLGNLSGMLQGTGISILLNMFYGPILNTARGISFQVQGTISSFYGGFMTASRPQIVKLYAAEKYKEMWRLVILSSYIAFYLTLFFTLPLCVETEFVLKKWLGSFPPFTVSFTILTLINGIVMATKFPRVAAIHATGHIKDTNITVGVILCAIFPLAYLLLLCGLNPNWVFVGVIVLTLLAEVVAINILHRYIDFSRREYWFKVYIKSCLIGVLCLVPTYFVHLLLPESWLRFILVACVSSISILLMGFYQGIDKDMRDQVKDLVKNKIGGKLKLFKFKRQKQ